MNLTIGHLGTDCNEIFGMFNGIKLPCNDDRYLRKVITDSGLICMNGRRDDYNTDNG